MSGIVGPDVASSRTPQGVVIPLDSVRTTDNHLPMAGELARAAHYWTLERVRRREITAATAARTRSILATLDGTQGNRQMVNISRRDIERWQGERSHVAASTRRHEFSVVRAFCRAMVDAGKMHRDPTRDMRTPKVPRPADRALSRDECDAIEAVLPDERARAIFALMRWVGLRRQEVLNLQVGDWDRRAQTLAIVGKGGHHRTEPVPPWVARHLAAYLAVMPAVGGPLIRVNDGSRGISNSYLGRLVASWMVDAGVKVAPFDGRAPHALRHTIASELIESGADIRTVQELLGHQSITSTQVYLRRAAVSRVRDALAAAHEDSTPPDLLVAG